MERPFFRRRDRCRNLLRNLAEQEERAVPYKDPEQRREYQRRWWQRRRQEWLAKNGPCRDCGAWDQLEVDHADRTTKQRRIANIWSRRREVREAELAKCQVLCRECHELKSHEHGDYLPPPAQDP